MAGDQDEALGGVKKVELRLKAMLDFAVGSYAINNIEQALAEPQIAAREMLVNIPHPLNPAFRMVGSPIKLSGTPVEYRRPAPMLGQDTDDVLAGQLGLSDAQLAELKAGGIIEQRPGC